jgi:hypothetical protein
MTNNVVFRQIRGVFLLALLNEFFVGKFKAGTSGKSTPAFTRSSLLHLVDGKQYGKISIRVECENTIDKIEYENANVNPIDLDQTLLIHFDFTKEDPSLTFKLIDTSIRMRNPESFELQAK